MRHFCIFEVHRKNMESSFVDNFDDCYGDALEFCTAMNNFTSDDDIYYCVRCLDEVEFLHRFEYNPFFNSIVYAYS